MSHDEGLLERIRELVDGDDAVTEKKMFGGVAFLADGKMFCGLAGEDLMVRVGPAAHEAALARPHARPMDFTGKPMKGYVYVAPEGLSEDDALAAWVREARGFVATLPAKSAPQRTKKKDAATESVAKTRKGAAKKSATTKRAAKKPTR
ncbi:MAG: TfoX/Sxy family protein [Polyangiales bacterium]